jgi:type I restriction enzyme M protein
LIAQFFKEEADAIDVLEANIAEIQSELDDAIENAQEVAAYEADEDETITAAIIKKALKDLIDDLRGSQGASAQKELDKLMAEEEAIAALEKRIRGAKAELRKFADELEQKLQLKRLGGNEFKLENQQLLVEVDRQLATLDEAKKDERKRIVALNKDKVALQARIDKTDVLMASIGGRLTEQQAKALILAKLYDFADHRAKSISEYRTASSRPWR